MHYTADLSFNLVRFVYIGFIHFVSNGFNKFLTALFELMHFVFIQTYDQVPFENYYELHLVDLHAACISYADSEAIFLCR